MLTLKSITMRNFLSVGNVTQAIRLDDHGLTLVLGHNSDSNGGITKNGAGKTAILQAISFALYGQPLTKIKVDNLINNINQKGMLVTLDFDIDEKSYRIERGRKPNVLKFFVNGEEIEDMSRGENRETQDDINRLVGMTHQMFTHIVALNTYTIPFLRLRAAEQREVSEELLGVMQISERAEVLKKLMGTTKDMLRQEDANIKATQEANTRINRAIQQAEQQAAQWLANHNESVATFESQIAELSVIDFDQEKLVFDAVDAWNAHQRDLESKLGVHVATLRGVEDQLQRASRDVKHAREVNPAASHQAARDRMKKDRERKQTEVNKLCADTIRLSGEMDALQEKIDNPSEHNCVTCAQPLEGTDHMKTVMGNLEAEMARLLVRLDDTQNTVREIELEISSVKDEEAKSEADEKTAVETWTNNLSKLEEWLAELTVQQTSAKEAIRSAKDGMMSDEEKPQTIFDTRDDLYATKHLLDQCVQELERERVKENPYDGHLLSLRGTLQDVDFVEINRLTELQRHQDFLMKLLTNKDSFVRKKIIDQNLYYLNTRLNFYLQKLGLPHEVVFQNDLTTEISLLGRDFDFEQLSRGEMNRVIMSVSWAFRDVWESLNHPINLVWCDEVIDNGTDGNGAEAALAVLKSFGRNKKNVFLISHRDELVGRIDRVLLVSKDNGFTTIDEQA